jgi:hypothetical protein
VSDRGDSWTGNSFPSGWTGTLDPAVDAARIVADKTTSITAVRAGSALDAQNVRLEGLSGRGRQVQTAPGITAQVDVLIIGYKSHPAVDDTDLQVGDRFAVGGVSYEVINVVPGLVNQFQAYAKVRR